MINHCMNFVYIFNFIENYSDSGDFIYKDVIVSSFHLNYLRFSFLNIFRYT